MDAAAVDVIFSLFSTTFSCIVVSLLSGFCSQFSIASQAVWIPPQTYALVANSQKHLILLHENSSSLLFFHTIHSNIQWHWLLSYLFSIHTSSLLSTIHITWFGYIFVINMFPLFEIKALNARLFYKYKYSITQKWNRNFFAEKLIKVSSFGIRNRSGFSSLHYFHRSYAHISHNFAKCLHVYVCELATEWNSVLIPLNRKVSMN